MVYEATRLHQGNSLIIWILVKTNWCQYVNFTKSWSKRNFHTPGHFSGDWEIQGITETQQYLLYSDRVWSTVQVKLETLHFSTFIVHENITSTTIGLENLILEINLLVLQASLSFRNDENKISCLCLAVLDAPWEQTAICQLSTMNLSFNQFLLAVRDGLQLYNEKGQTDSASVHFPRYGRPHAKNKFRLTSGNNQILSFQSFGNYVYSSKVAS